MSVVVLAIIAFLLYRLYGAYQRETRAAKSDGIQIEQLENDIDEWQREFAKVVASSERPESYVLSRRDKLETVERKYIRLKQRYRHDQTNLLEVGSDWLEYVRASTLMLLLDAPARDGLERIERLMKQLDNHNGYYKVTDSDVRHDFHKLVVDEKQRRVALQEIERRFDESLSGYGSSPTR